MDTDVSAALQRTRRYWVTDGLWELISGISISVLALGFMVLRWVPLLGMVPFLMMFLSPRVLEWARERITYPRSGYAAPLMLSLASLPRGLIMGLIMLSATLLVSPFLAIAFQLAQPEWSRAIFRLFDVALPTGGCLLFSGAFANVGYYFKLSRFYLLAAFSVLVGLMYCGLVFTPQGIRLMESDILNSEAALPFLCIGVALVLSGAITLRSYLRAHPQPLEEAG